MTPPATQTSPPPLPLLATFALGGLLGWALGRRGGSALRKKSSLAPSHHEEEEEEEDDGEVVTGKEREWV